MALINCPECGGKVSDKANACPHCGCSSEYFTKKEIALINVEKEDEYLVKLGCFDLYFPCSCKKYFALRKPFEEFAWGSKNLVELFYNQTPDIGKILERVSDSATVCLNDIVEHGMKVLYENNISMTPEAFLKKYFLNPNYKMDYDVAISEVVTKYSEITNEQKALEEYRAMQKAARGKWQGGGFGVAGAMKGAITASALNAGSSFIHSFGDSYRKNKDDKYINNKLSELRESSFAKEKIIDGVYDVAISVFYAVMNELKTQGYQGKIYLEEDFITAKNIFDAACKYEINEDILVQKYLESIKIYPYYDKPYLALYEAVKDTQEELSFLKTLETFGMDIPVNGLNVYKHIEIGNTLSTIRGFNDLKHFSTDNVSVENCIKILDFISYIPNKNIDNDELSKTYYGRLIQQKMDIINSSEIRDEIYVKGDIFYDDKKYEKALYYFLYAAKLNSSDAMYMVGIIYKGMREYEDALKWLKKAAAHNNTDALIHIGDIYEKKDKSEYNFSLAMKYFKEAAELGNAVAYKRIGDLYYRYNTLVTETNAKLALENYIKASELGVDIGSQCAGKVYGNYFENHDMAHKYYELTVKQANGNDARSKRIKAIAFNDLALHYEYGAGCEKDYKKAEELYLLSLEMNDDETTRNNYNELKSKMVLYEKRKCPKCGYYDTIAVEKGFFNKKKDENERKCPKCGNIFRIN